MTGRSHFLFLSRLMLLVVVTCGASFTRAYSQSGLFQPTGELKVARRDHTATRLSNGLVLVTGGCGVQTCTALASSEIYDPVTGLFTLTGTMTKARISHTATLLPTGKVLIAGETSAELFDPFTSAFQPTGSPARTLGASWSFLLPSGKVLIVANAALSIDVIAAHLYDPATGQFTQIGDFFQQRRAGTATLLDNGKILLLGGIRHLTALGSAELLDPETGSVTTAGEMLRKRWGHTATLLPNHKVLVVGGSHCFSNDPACFTRPTPDAEIYDPATGLFTPSAAAWPGSFPPGATATLLPNGLVLLTSRGDTFLYDPVNDNLVPGAQMVTQRFSTAVVPLKDGRVLYVGGSNEAGTLSNAEVFVWMRHTSIDLKPGDEKNTVNRRSSAAVAVAILSAGPTASTPVFDATTVNSATVTLAGAAPVAPGSNGQGRGTGAAGPLAQTVDVNRDGRLDLLLHFRASDMQLPAPAPDGTVEAVLYGETFSGQSIRGSDTIRLVP